MNYRHHFIVRAPLSRVVEFHRQSASMAAITPPPVVVRMQHAPAILADGDEMVFTMWLGLLPVNWRACIEDVSSNGFTDRQLRGPFTEWVHHHAFAALDEQTTEIIDKISLTFRLHLIWGPVGLAMCLGLPVLFAYRGWKTRRLLQ